MSKYFRDLYDAIVTTLKGMSVTIKHFFSKPVTVQYPDEQLPVADAYLGKHKLDQEGCIACSQCAKMCPVECIHLDFERHPGKVVEWKKFTVNYNHCIFCGLCVETCPTDVLHMTKETDLSEFDRKDCLVDFLTYRGLRPEDYEKIEIAKKEAEEKKRKKAEAAKKKKAEEAAAAGEEKVEKTEEKAEKTETTEAQAEEKPAEPEKDETPPEKTEE
ncbi:MAG: NuoI/complex I 23 kDa subunit family protein [Planctomycetota bacterium]|jgi:NADH-quinone oxidoreductase subunit I